MYIQEITVEGFKSYAQRVTLSNFDSAFNAITGLNGSGKSNILDSICFVLGIKNLSQVSTACRASYLLHQHRWSRRLNSTTNDRIAVAQLLHHAVCRPVLLQGSAHTDSGC